MRKAFTLIELLIVVAIIAILAAIAVPNFLEAQVRSKVARCKADMRSIGTAVEAYSVDNNRPPIGEWESGETPGHPAYPYPTNYVIAVASMTNSLTTPVAYITAVPVDPFLDKNTWNYPGSTYKHTNIKYRYNSYATSPANPLWSATTMNFYYHAPRIAANGFTWMIESLGPSKTVAAGQAAGEQVATAMISFPRGEPGSVSYVYDTTNGTMSKGYIMRTNKGEYPQ